MITEELVIQIRDWLGTKGISFFKSLKATYGRVDAIWTECGIPHVVHFREGMQVRNKLRDLTNGAWTSYEYDDNWIEVIERAIQ